MADKNWFDVDRKGLAKLIERRGKIALIHELIANAWDADGVKLVEVILEPEEGVPHATIVVRDDAPDGFTDLSQSWTLFAESNRKAQATKRGRFCVGEKLVLALCVEASIISTTGAVMFDARGRSNMKARRPQGTEFMGIARITRSELAEIKIALKRLLSPPGITTRINGEALPTRSPIKTIEATLSTEIADEEGVLRRTARKTTIGLYAPLPGETATLFELGIPVVEIGDKWSLDIGQKVPLNLDRDNVTPAYLRDVRTIVVNAMHAHLDEADANATFVNEALADEHAAPEAVSKALDLKYGEKRAIWDPSDPEANMNLVAQGYTLIKGGQLTADQWANVKKHDGAKTRPAGQIAPTKKALFAPDGKDTWVPREKWTREMRAVVEYTEIVCRELVQAPVRVSILSDVTEGWAACYGDQSLVFNLGRLGHAFFEACVEEESGGHVMRPTLDLNRLLIHECAHSVASNHLDEAYHEALCHLGARLTKLAILRPSLFCRNLGRYP